MTLTCPNCGSTQVRGHLFLEIHQDAKGWASCDQCDWEDNDGESVHRIFTIQRLAQS